MLGEKNLYAHCDDNPIMRVDGDGQCWNILVGVVIGAAMNVLAGGVAAAVTGQEYTVGDMVAAEGLEKTIAITWGATYGVGAEGTAASVSRGFSMETAETKMQVKNIPHEKKVGQGRHFDGRTGTSFKFSIWKTATGSLKKRPHKTYIPLRAQAI